MREDAGFGTVYDVRRGGVSETAASGAESAGIRRADADSGGSVADIAEGEGCGGDREDGVGEDVRVFVAGAGEHRGERIAKGAGDAVARRKVASGGGDADGHRASAHAGVGDSNPRRVREILPSRGVPLGGALRRRRQGRSVARVAFGRRRRRRHARAIERFS